MKCWNLCYILVHSRYQKVQFNWLQLGWLTFLKFEKLLMEHWRQGSSILMSCYWHPVILRQLGFKPINNWSIFFYRTLEAYYMPYLEVDIWGQRVKTTSSDQWSLWGAVKSAMRSRSTHACSMSEETCWLLSLMHRVAVISQHFSCTVFLLNPAGSSCFGCNSNWFLVLL